MASDAEIAAATSQRLPHESHHPDINVEMLEHPIAGRSLRNYVMLSSDSTLADALQLDQNERFWSRYYWFGRFVREWSAAVGYDAGLEQQLFQLLEITTIDYDYDSLSEVDAAIARDVSFKSG